MEINFENFIKFNIQVGTIVDVKENKKKDFNYFNQLQNAKNYLKRNKLLWNAIDRKINKFDKKKTYLYFWCWFSW